jgi:tRNA(fMet)-specific endonuclease VapC
MRSVRYLIDTSSLSYAIREDDFALRRLVLGLGLDQIGVSCMTVLEIEYGLQRRRVERSNAVRALLGSFESIAFDADDARAAGALRADMETRGVKIGLVDTLIAAQALVRDLTVVTHDGRDFSQIRALRVIEL